MASARKVSNTLLINVAEVAAYYNIESMFDSCAGHIANLPLPDSFTNRLKIYYFQLALRSVSYGDNFLELYNSFNELEQQLFERSTQADMDNFRWLHGRRLLIVQIALSFLSKSLKMICSSTPSTPQDISIPSSFDYIKYSRDIKELLREKYDDYEGRQFDENDLEANFEQDFNHFTKDLLHGDNKKKTIHPMKVFELFSSHSLESTCHYLATLMNEAEDLVLGVPDVAVVSGQAQGADMGDDDSYDAAAQNSAKDSVSSDNVKMTRSTRRNQAITSSQSSSQSSQPTPAAATAAAAPKTTRSTAAASSSKAPTQAAGKVKSNASPAVVGPIAAASEKLKRKYDKIDPLQDALGGGDVSSSKSASASNRAAQSKKKLRKTPVEEEGEMDIDEDEEEDEEEKEKVKPLTTRSSKSAPSTSATSKGKVAGKPSSSSSSKLPILPAKEKTACKSPAPAPKDKGRRLTDSRPSGKKVSPISDIDMDMDVDDEIEDTSTSSSDSEQISHAMTMLKKSTKPRESLKKSPLPAKLGKSPMRSPTNGNRNVHFGVRMRRPWTAEEIDALNRGIRRHGQGNWTAILEDPQFSSILKNRTNVDLKDKDRNLRKNE